MYCTIEDLINRVTEKTLVNLTNDVLPANSVKKEIAEENITIADDLINSSLRNKYILPLKSVPNLVKQLSADIAIYRLYCRRPQNVPENYKKNYEVEINLKPFVTSIIDKLPDSILYEKAKQFHLLDEGYNLCNFCF